LLNNALTNGNLNYTTNAIAGTLSHEIGHTLSLLHINKTNIETPNGLPPIMGTGAIDLPNQDRIGEREFSLRGFNAQADEEEPDVLKSITDFYGLSVVDGDEAEGTNFDNLFPIADAEQFHVQQLVNAIGLRDAPISTSVPFEFSPTMGLFLVGGTWGFASLGKKMKMQKLHLK
jgi:hypothetical protein